MNSGARRWVNIRQKLGTLVETFLLPVITVQLAPATPRASSGPTATTVCSSSSATDGAHGAMLLNLRRAHHIEHSEKQKMEGKTITSEQVPTRPVGKNDSSEREDDPLW